MSSRLAFGGIALAALVAGGLLWWTGRPADRGPPVDPASIAPSALYAASFREASGASRALGQFQGHVLVINFWATWCTPCVEEMPAFSRLHDRWQASGVRFLGLSAEEPAKAAEFGRRLGIAYPLWTGGHDEVFGLSRRLGNRLGVLPHTVIVGRSGEVLDVKVGAYSELELDRKLRAFSAN